MHEMSTDAVKDILKASRLGVLALNEDQNSYAVPLYYAFDGDAVYFHCHPGMKDEYLEATNEACFVVIHTNSENVWESVQVFGKVEKLSLSSDINAAKSALFDVPFPPAEGHYPSGKPIRTDQHVYYARLVPLRFAGKESAPAAVTS